MKRKHGAPWFVHNSIDFIESRIQPDWLCYEWGSGWSTVWLAELAGHTISVEHDPEWHKQTIGYLQQYGYQDRAEVLLRGLDAGYADHILTFPDNHFDLIEIDGRRRADCTRNAITKLKPNGILIIDNSEREQYQDSINAAGVRQWEHVDFYSGHSDGWTTSVYWRPK